MPDQARSIIARIAVVCGADAEDLVARKDVLNSWAGDVDTILDVLNIKWVGIPSVTDERLGEWFLVAVSPETAEKLTKSFYKIACEAVGGERGFEGWVKERNRVVTELISAFVELAIKERLQKAVDDFLERHSRRKGFKTSPSVDVDLESFDFTYLPKYDKDLIMSFAEMCGARDDLVNSYRFFEDEEFRRETIDRILETRDVPPSENLRSWYSLEGVELYEDWYTRAVAWFQEVLPGLLTDYDHFPAYRRPSVSYAYDTMVH